MWCTTNWASTCNTNRVVTSTCNKCQNFHFYAVDVAWCYERVDETSYWWLLNAFLCNQQTKRDRREDLLSNQLSYGKIIFIFYDARLRKTLSFSDISHNAFWECVITVTSSSSSAQGLRKKPLFCPNYCRLACTINMFTRRSTTKWRAPFKGEGGMPTLAHETTQMYMSET